MSMSDDTRVLVGGALGGAIPVLAICGLLLAGWWCAATFALAGSWALREWSR